MKKILTCIIVMALALTASAQTKGETSQEKKSTPKVIVKETPKVEGAELIKNILAENKGKVVFFDFWATWCGPCRSGISAMEPKKEAFAGKPVTFVYVTNESSPEETWSDAVKSMPGTHYRIPNDLWKGVKEIGNAIPRYLIYDKEGKQVYQQTGFDKTVLEKILEVLNEEVEK